MHSTQQPKKLLYVALLLMVCCSAASLLKTPIKVTFGRLALHVAYLIWMTVVGVIGTYSLRKWGNHWCTTLYASSYLFVVGYAIISEMIGFAIPSFQGYTWLSAMATTVFIFCSPAPFIACLLLLRRFKNST